MRSVTAFRLPVASEPRTVEWPASSTTFDSSPVVVCVWLRVFSAASLMIVSFPE